MTGPLGSVEALLPPEHGIIIVAGAAADFLDNPFSGEVPLCSASDDILYLMSASDSYHCARVVLESWAAAPPDDRQDVDAHQQVTLALSDGTVHVSGMLEFRAQSNPDPRAAGPLPRPRQCQRTRRTASDQSPTGPPHPDQRCRTVPGPILACRQLTYQAPPTMMSNRAVSRHSCWRRTTIADYSGWSPRFLQADVRKRLDTLLLI